MRILVVSGIWPPDVGGPASHAPDVAAHLSRSHDVTVVTTADRPPQGRPYRVRYTSRALPTGARHAASFVEVARRAAPVDVVYSTGLFARAAGGAALTRTPLVLKLTGDPAFERLRARGEFEGDIDAFETAGGPRARAARLLRGATVRQASAVVCPSGYLHDRAIAWGAAPENVAVVPNPAPDVSGVASREALRARHSFDGPTIVFAGRLTVQKDLPSLLDALGHTNTALRLVVVGGGPERAALETLASQLDLGARVTFLGPRSREVALELMRAADATVLPSAWENFPHSVVESLALGTPVVASRTGGVAEVVTDGANGLLVEPSRPRELAAALDALPTRAPGLREAAAPSVAHLSPARVLDTLERIIVGAS